VASIETYLNYAESLQNSGHAALPELVFPQPTITSRTLRRSTIPRKTA